MTQHLHISLHPDLFTFINPRNEILELKTTVYVTNNGKQWKLMSIGEFPNAPTEVVKIDLFGQQLLPPEINKYELLSLFLSFGSLRSCQNSFHVLPPLKPIFVFHGIERFSNILCGYERAIFSSAAELAGAKKVIFE